MQVMDLKFRLLQIHGTLCIHSCKLTRKATLIKKFMEDEDKKLSTEEEKIIWSCSWFSIFPKIHEAFEECMYSCYKNWTNFSRIFETREVYSRVASSWKFFVHRQPRMFKNSLNQICIKNWAFFQFRSDLPHFRYADPPSLRPVLERTLFESIGPLKGIANRANAPCYLAPRRPKIVKNTTFFHFRSD